MTTTPQPAAGPLDPLVPRPIDLPMVVPLAPDADLTALDAGKIFVAPDDPADWDAWRAALTRWRAEARGRFPDHAARYEGAGAWSSGCFVVAQVWLWDELLYDAAERRFTPEKLVADAAERFGGFDGVVLWHAYPVIGIDERNQWDFYREVPGLRELVAALHDAGLRVFCDFNPWDTGTRRGGSDAEELASLIADFAFDGVFLDTLKQADAALIDPLFVTNPIPRPRRHPSAPASDHRRSVPPDPGGDRARAPHRRRLRCRERGRRRDVCAPRRHLHRRGDDPRRPAHSGSGGTLGRPLTRRRAPEAAPSASWARPHGGAEVLGGVSRSRRRRESKSSTA